MAALAAGALLLGLLCVGDGLFDCLLLAVCETSGHVTGKVEITGLHSTDGVLECRAVLLLPGLLDLAQGSVVRIGDNRCGGIDNFPGAGLS